MKYFTLYFTMFIFPSDFLRFAFMNIVIIVDIKKRFLHYNLKDFFPKLCDCCVFYWQFLFCAVDATDNGDNDADLEEDGNDDSESDNNEPAEKQQKLQ